MTAAADPSKLRVAICIATYRRPAGLAALIASLDALVFSGQPPEITILVVDNDASSASTVSGALACHSRWRVLHEVEPRRGIVAARNRLLSLVPPGTDMIAFLDDDETVTPGWLSALLATAASTGAEVVQGPVTPVFATPPPAWLETTGLYALGPFEEGAPLVFAATNNTLVCWPFVQRHGLRFDPRFNLTGGEDQEFFTRLRRAGGRIVASRDAVVRDHVPANRMRMGWALRRAYRIGNSLGRISRLHRRGRAMRLAKGAGMIGLGILRAGGPGLFSMSHRARGLTATARGAGMLTGFLAVDFAEYGDEAVSHDRTERS